MKTHRRYRLTLRLWVILSAVMAVTATLSTYAVLFLQRRFVQTSGVFTPGAPEVMFAAAVAAGAMAAIAGVLIGLAVSRRIWGIVKRAEAAISVAGPQESPARTVVRDELGALEAAVGRLNLSMDRFISDSDILARLPASMLVVDDNERLVSWNATAEALLGPDLARSLGVPLFGEQGPFFGSAGGREIAALARDRETASGTVQADDVSATTRDGKGLLLDVTVQRQHGRGHESGVLVLLLRDAREKRRIREQIRRADQLALLGGMAAQVAHEVRTPLAIVRGLVELLQADLPDDQRCQQYAERIVDALDRQERLVQKLLTLSHPEPETWEPVMISELLNELVSAWPGRRPTVKIEGPVAAVPGDSILLNEVFTNLIQNALEASPADEVVVRVGTTDDGVRVVVSNYGAGIPPELQQRVFQPFFTTKPRGTGLGLAIARHVVEAHRGTIQLDSDGRSATHFIVDLPSHRLAEAGVVDG